MRTFGLALYSHIAYILSINSETHSPDGENQNGPAD